MRIATQTLSNIVDERLKCKKHEAPPDSISVTDGTYRHDDTFAFSSQYILDFSNDEQTSFQYDIEISFPHKDYYFDVELRSDFVSNNLKMALLAKDPASDKYHRVANSKWENQE